MREDRDSNPGASCPANGFQDRRLRPLGHPPARRVPPHLSIQGTASTALYSRWSLNSMRTAPPACKQSPSCVGTEDSEQDCCRVSMGCEQTHDGDSRVDGFRGQAQTSLVIPGNACQEHHPSLPCIAVLPRGAGVVPILSRAGKEVHDDPNPLVRARASARLWCSPC